MASIQPSGQNASGSRGVTLLPRSRLQLETPLTSRLYTIIATSNGVASWEVKFPNQVRQSQSINQRLARAVRCPNHPGAESIHKAPPIGHAYLLHLVIIGALGCPSSPCSYQDPSVLAALQQPHRPSLRRPERRFSAPSVGLYCIVAPHYLFPGIWAFTIPDYNYTTTTPLTLATAGFRLEGKDLACYNNHVVGSAGRPAAAAGCRERCW